MELKPLITYNEGYYFGRLRHHSHFVLGCFYPSVDCNDIIMFIGCLLRYLVTSIFAI